MTTRVSCRVHRSKAKANMTNTATHRTTLNAALETYLYADLPVGVRKDIRAHRADRATPPGREAEVAPAENNSLFWSIFAMLVPSLS